jgi:hypothetical protein
MLTIFDEVALAPILIYYPSYEHIHSEVHVRITDLPLSSSLRDLCTRNLNHLVRVSGVVTRRTGVFPQLKYVKFDCSERKAVLGLSLQLPSISSVSTEPISFTQVPALDTVHDKLVKQTISTKKRFVRLRGTSASASIIHLIYLALVNA